MALGGGDSPQDFSVSSSPLELIQVSNLLQLGRTWEVLGLGLVLDNSTFRVIFGQLLMAHKLYPIHYFTSENTGSLIVQITCIVLVRVIELLMQSIERLVQVIEVLVQSIELLMQSIELLVRPLVQFWPNYNQEADYCIWSEVMMSDWRLHRRRCLFQSI